jgi:hypothetical protein
MNNFYPEFRSYCAKPETGIKTLGYAGALDIAFGPWLVDRLGGLHAGLRSRSAGAPGSSCRCVYGVGGAGD